MLLLCIMIVDVQEHVSLSAVICLQTFDVMYVLHWFVYVASKPFVHFSHIIIRLGIIQVVCLLGVNKVVVVSFCAVG